TGSGSPREGGRRSPTPPAADWDRWRPEPMLRIRGGVGFPVTAPPIEAGAVLVGTDGRITAVGPNARVPTPRDVEQLEFKDGVLTPGLVNVHTHLELT